jgi:hypothetical protein
MGCNLIIFEWGYELCPISNTLKKIGCEEGGRRLCFGKSSLCAGLGNREADLIG